MRRVNKSLSYNRDGEDIRHGLNNSRLEEQNSHQATIPEQKCKCQRKYYGMMSDYPHRKQMAMRTRPHKLRLGV